MSGLWHDLRYAVRSQARTPLFAIVVIFTLSFGLGVNAAVFRVLKSVLLDRLPYADSDRLVRVYVRLLDGTQDRAALSTGAVAEIVARQRSFESLTAFQSFTSDAVFGIGDLTRSVKVGWVGPRFLETLGSRLVFGRTFRDEERASGFVPLTFGQAGVDSASAVLVAHPTWQQLLASDPDILGRSIHINGVARTVIGVLPRDFVGPTNGRSVSAGEADFYLAFDPDPVLANANAAWNAGWLGLVGRLKPGVGFDVAQRELGVIWDDIAREHPKQYANTGISAMPLRDAMAGNIRMPLLVLMASAGFVLLIASANLAGVLLSRSLSRRREFGVRIALGAGRRRLVRQLLTESVTLAIAGGAVGLALASGLMTLLRRLSLTALPFYADVSMDISTVLATLALTLCTGIAFGLVPALAITHSDVQSMLRDQSRTASEGARSHHLRGILVATQLAFCAALVAGAALMAQALWNVMTPPLGFDPDGVLTAGIRLPPRNYGVPEARGRFLENLTERLQELSGVEAAAISTSIPTAIAARPSFRIEGQAIDGSERPVLFASVSDDYFHTLRIPIRRGRTFNSQDRADNPGVIVISEAAARRYWRGDDPIGSRIRFGESDTFEVIGIVGDVRNDPARADAEPMAYTSNRQMRDARVRILLRTSGDPFALVRPVERTLASIDPSLPLQEPVTLRSALGDRLTPRQVPVVLMASFGGLALLLACLGVYGMFAGMAVARKREFGVRMALGSRPRAIAVLMLRQGVGWMTIGLAGGTAATALLLRLLNSFIEDVPRLEPLALSIALGIIVVVSMAALMIPVRSAARVDPVVALRYD
jgi:predicted permease